MTRALCAFALLTVALGTASAGKPAAEAVDPHLDAGQTAFDDGDLNGAARELKLSIEARPSARAWLLLGNTYLQLGQLDDARNAFDETLKLEKRSSQRATVQKLIAGLKGVTTVKMMITSQPPGAAVYVDLKAAGRRGQTPIEVLVVPGRHRIIYTLDGYEETLASPDPDAVAGKVAVVDTVLRPKGCDVSVKAQQPGMRGLVDGTEKITLPTTVRVRPGKHEVELAGRGLAAKTVSIECVDFKPLTIEETLGPTTVGAVQVHAEAGEKVFVDGKAVPVAEAANLTLPAGPHEIKVETASGPVRREVVTVEAGEKTDVTPKAPPPVTSITGLVVVPHPEDAGLWLDGKPLPPRATNVVTPGPHLLEARANGQLGWSQQLDIKPGEITRIEARLTSRTHTGRTVGIVFTALAVAAEATAIVAYINESESYPGSEARKNWGTISLAGHITAGACLGVAIGGFVADVFQDRAAANKPQSARVSAAVVPIVGGGSLVVSGSF